MTRCTGVSPPDSSNRHPPSFLVSSPGTSLGKIPSCVAAVSMLPSLAKDLGMHNASQRTQWNFRLGPLATEKNPRAVFVKSLVYPSPQHTHPHGMHRRVQEAHVDEDQPCRQRHQLTHPRVRSLSHFPPQRIPVTNRQGAVSNRETEISEREGA
jgi:hypothetical protein